MIIIYNLRQQQQYPATTKWVVVIALDKARKLILIFSPILVSANGMFIKSDQEQKTYKEENVMILVTGPSPQNGSAMCFLGSNCCYLETQGGSKKRIKLISGALWQKKHAKATAIATCTNILIIHLFLAT